jgi:hypothetical protein
MSATYAIAVHPVAVLLGEPVTFELRCQAESDSPRTLTFDHASLTVELSRVGHEGEPARAFPNRRVVLDGGTLVRMSSPGGIEDLSASEQRTRRLESTSLLPVQLLDVGAFAIACVLTDGSREVRSEAAHFRIDSGPASVPQLFDRLEDTDLGIRSRVATLLHRQTAHGLDYDPTADEPTRARSSAAWRTWWTTVGQALPWSYASGHATFGAPPEAPSAPRRSDRLGGIAFAQEKLTPASHEVLVRLLRAFQAEPSAAVLEGQELVGDHRFGYPADPVFVEGDAPLVGALSATLGCLSDHARAGADLATAALIVLRTVARVPSPSLFDPLQRLEVSTLGVPTWAAVRVPLQALLDLLEPSFAPSSSGPITT